MPRDDDFLDSVVTRERVQPLSNADAVAAFFAYLGYQTDPRIVQTPANLGISADSLIRAIRRVELIADQQGLLQVCLFELRSVAVAATQGVARAFRNRAGNYLAVLTRDYSRIDFVLLERSRPVTEGGPFDHRQASIRPRTLSLDRRNPEPRHLRALQRLTYTESDPSYQYDKLRSAYDAAYWSEEHFDNRYVIANLIACQPDTPRVVGDCDIFKLQDAVIEGILRSFQEQQALEAAPTIIDPFQQTVATTLQEYLSHPDLRRPQVLAAIRFVNRAMVGPQKQ